MFLQREQHCNCQPLTRQIDVSLKNCTCFNSNAKAGLEQMSSFLTVVNQLLICTMQETKNFKGSLFSSRKKCEKISQCAFRRATSIAFEMHGKWKGLLNLIFDSRGLDPESKIVHLHILQCRLCNFQPHFKCIERDICDFTKAFFQENSLYHVCFTQILINQKSNTCTTVQAYVYVPE